MDLGAGDGAATDLMRAEHGMHPVALVVMDYEYKKISGKGHEVYVQDFHKITLPDESFDGSKSALCLHLYNIYYSVEYLSICQTCFRA